jgi:hypothetical protein
VTDVMTVGVYPHDPLPGPDHTYVDAPYPRGEYVWGLVYPQRFPEKNPIHEDPYFFPGNAWKGTSGMPQRVFV